MDTLNIDNNSKIDVIVMVCHKCADILKDPTFGGTKELTSEARTHARESAYEDIVTAVETLAAIANFNEGFFDIVNIANKLKIDIHGSAQ
jgi:hypothetical protein